MYRPGCLEHYVLHQLRNDPAFVPELDFVMTLDGQLIGQNMFMKAVLAADDGRSIPIMTMGPICIAPELKRKEDASFCLCEELMPGYLNGITGEYAPPAGYLVNEKEAEAFDREFPYMEKKKLPGRFLKEIFGKLGLRICNSFVDFNGKPSSDNDIQLMVYSIRE